MRNSSISKICEIELRYRPSKKYSEQRKIISSHDAYDLLCSTWDQNKLQLLEQFKMVLLTRANSVLGIVELSSGSTTGTVVDIRLLCAAAIKANAISIIIAHNHPSGNTKASQADIELTRKVKEATSLFDMKLLDHLIITQEAFLSMADEGHL